MAQALGKAAVDGGLETTLEEGLAIEQEPFLAGPDRGRGAWHGVVPQHGAGKATFVGR